MFEELEKDVATKDVALTLKKIVPLFNVVNDEIKKLATNEVPLTRLAGKGFLRFEARILKKITKASVKNISKKIPVGVEMPKVVSVGNGQIKSVPKGKNVKDIQDIEVNSILPEIEAPH